MSLYPRQQDVLNKLMALRLVSILVRLVSNLIINTCLTYILFVGKILKSHSI